jgi:hypothetical protein
MTRTILGLSWTVVSVPLLMLPAVAAQPDGLTVNKPLVLAQQCAQRVGPFATQDTAWQRFNQARSQGYSVSNGVVPCWDGSGTRGYCFNVFTC